MNGQSGEPDSPTKGLSVRLRTTAMIVLICAAVAVATCVVWKTWIVRRFETAAYLRCGGLGGIRAEGEPPSWCGNDVTHTPAERSAITTALDNSIRSRSTLAAAVWRRDIRDLSIIANKKDPVGWLSRNLQVAFPDDYETMKVSLSGHDRRETAILVNAVVDAYMSEVVDAERKNRENRISELKALQSRKAEEIKDQLSDLRRMGQPLANYEPEGLSPRQKGILDELSQLRARAIRNQFESNRMSADLASYKPVLEMAENDAVPDIACRCEGNQDAFLDALAEEIAASEAAQDDMERARLVHLKELYATWVDTARKELREMRIRDCRTEIANREAAIEVNRKQQALLIKELNQLKKEADSGGGCIDMSMRRTAIDNEKKALDEITAEIEKLTVESKCAPRITILRKAEVPE
jgi:polysaccharide biosynthesis transport protein